MIARTPPTIECFLCRQNFPFGMGNYRGRHVHAWGVNICDTCEAGNWDGLVPEHHRALLKHLKERGIEVTLNEKGWLPIPK